MNMNSLRSFFAVSMLLVSTTVFCQEMASLEPEPIPTSTIAPAKKTPANTASVRLHKRFPKLFTGMAIEIATSTYPMDKTAPVFQQFGNVMYEKLTEGGYSYLIMANFSSKESALDFLQKVVKPRAEKARLIQFDEGNRKVIRD